MASRRASAVFAGLAACSAWAQVVDAGAPVGAAVLVVANPGFPPPFEPAAAADAGLPMSPSDLSSFFARGPEAQAKIAFDTGRFTEALLLLEQAGSSNPVRYLRALAALKAEDFEFAAAEFTALADDYPALRDRCWLQAGMAFEGSHAWAQAREAFAAISPRSRLFVDGTLGVARASLQLGDVTRARTVLAALADRSAPAWGRDVGAEALALLVDAAARAKEPSAERESLNALWARHPLSAQATRTEGRVKPSVEDTVTRAEVLVEAHRNARGVSLLEPLSAKLVLPDALACKAHLVLGKAYRKLRQHPKAIATLEPVVRQCTDAEVRAKAQYTVGLSLLATSTAQAASAFTALAREFPEHPFADDALFFAGEALQRNGEQALAEERWAELVDRYPRGDYAAEGLFKLFWNARADARWDDAVAALDEVQSRWASADEASDVERAMYWRGRLDEDRGLEGAGDRYAALAVAHPGSYYGLLALERLGEIDADRAATLLNERRVGRREGTPFPLFAGPLSNDPHFASAVELLRLGFGELVGADLNAIDRSQLPTDALTLMVYVMSVSGDVRIAHALARTWLKRPLNGALTSNNRLVWQLAYPLVYRDAVEASAAAARGLDPDLLQALIREESALDPKALSWAGALGLCQLMPATAAEVAAQLKLKPPSQADLMDPALNLRLGAQYLADLLARMKGSSPLALASYNAGAGAVSRWRREFPDDDLASWVERIPVEETRNYVKRVLRSYVTYKLLYAPNDVPHIIAPATTSTLTAR